MGRLAEASRSTAYAAGVESVSAAYHYLPFMQDVIASHITRLTDPNDRHLRWRIAGRLSKQPFAEQVASADRHWLGLDATPNASTRNPEQWPTVVIGVGREALTSALGKSPDRVPAIAFGVGPLALVGLGAELEPEPRLEFLRTATEHGDYDPDGAFMGVVVRAGSDPSTWSIGTSSPYGREIELLPTVQLSPGPLAEPTQLYRV